MIIHSPQNPRYKQWIKLHSVKYRKQFGLFLVEGEHLVNEAIKKDFVECLLVRESCPFASNIETYELSSQLMDDLCMTHSKEDVIAVCKIKTHDNMQVQRVLVCDRIQDPGNLGSLIRSAVAFGFDAVVCSHEGVDPHQDKVIRATQGAYFYVPILRVKLPEYLKTLKQEGLLLIGTGLSQAISMDAYPSVESFALVLGHEGQGIDSGVLALCDVVLKIDASQFESLNVAVAGGILMHHLVKQVTN